MGWGVTFFSWGSLSFCLTNANRFHNGYLKDITQKPNKYITDYFHII